MKKIKWITLITVVVFLLVSPCVNAKVTLDPKDTLRGIKDVNVNVKIDILGLNDKIRKDVVLKLRTAGIGVLPLDAPPKESIGKPILIVSVQTASRDKPLILYFTGVALFQAVKLINSNLETLAETWSSQNFGSVRKNRLENAILSTIKAQIDKFLNDHLAVNPVQPSKPKGK